MIRYLVRLWSLLAIGMVSVPFLWAAAPSLPSGLGGSGSVPSLPSGLGGGDARGDTSTGVESGLDVTGFIEARYGRRLSRAGSYSDTTLEELRGRLDWEREFGAVLLNASVDFLYDGEVDKQEFDLESGQSWLDLRVLNLEFGVFDSLDLKVGRQVATWGVGDLVFINDLFSKDWNSFFLGRDVEYLKAPQDSVRASWYQEWANIDLVYSPQFESDRFIDGERLVYFDGASGGLIREPSAIDVDERNQSFDDDEIHLRVSRLFGSVEYAAYAYSGFWKSPAGMDTETGLSVFPRLAVYGMSARGPLARGVVSFEGGYYDSHDYGRHVSQLVRPSESRLLIGYERELGTDLTGSLQYYVESPRGNEEGAKDREMVTLRLRKQLMQQRLTLSLFVFYSPSDYDSYSRLGAIWKATDDWRYDVGVNLFRGTDRSFFGQFGENDNAYVGLRRVF